MTAPPVPQSAAAQRVRALVSGYPAVVRRARHLLMLQAYLDESAKGDYLVVAGYITTVDKWAEFSDRWQELLTLKSPHYPRFDEFHMNQMTNSPERREMTEWYYRIIEGHAQYAIACTVNCTDLAAVYAEFDWPFKNAEVMLNPYFHAFANLCRGFERYKGEMGVTEKVDFIFDDNSSKVHCMTAWDALRKHRPDFAATCGETPIFRSSETMLPLQAADLFAWFVRDWRNQGKGASTGDVGFPWEAKANIPVLDIYFEAKHFRADFSRMLKIHELRLQGVPNPESHFPASPPPELVKVS